jgi:hypothetical protein
MSPERGADRTPTLDFSVMKNTRAAWATGVLGTTAAGALWLYFYRQTAVVEYVGYTYGVVHEFHDPVTVREQPWWSAPGAVGLTVVGIAAVLWLLPDWRIPLGRFVQRLGNPSHRTG